MPSKLVVEPLDVSAHEGTQELRGYLKCIYLDYDFKNVDHAGFNAKHLLLPMRQLLDGAVERLVFVHLVKFVDFVTRKRQLSTPT